MILVAALAGQADAIVYCGKDLLTPSPFEGIPDLSPAPSLEMLHPQSHG